MSRSINKFAVDVAALLTAHALFPCVKHGAARVACVSGSGFSHENTIESRRDYEGVMVEAWSCDGCG